VSAACLRAALCLLLSRAILPRVFDQLDDQCERDSAGWEGGALRGSALDCLHKYPELLIQQRGFFSPTYEIYAPNGQRVLTYRWGGSFLARDIRIADGAAPGAELLRIKSARAMGYHSAAYDVIDTSEDGVIGTVSRGAQNARHKWEVRLPDGAPAATALEDSLAVMRMLLAHPAERRFDIFGADGDLLGQVLQRFAPFKFEARVKFFKECAPDPVDRRLLLAAAVLIALLEGAPGNGS
jgi:hypothetical protein